MKSRFKELKKEIEINDKYTQSLITDTSGILHLHISQDSRSGLNLNYCLRVPSHNNDQFNNNYKLMNPKQIDHNSKLKVEYAMIKWSQVANINFQQGDPCDIYIFSIHDDYAPAIISFTTKFTYCFRKDIKINPNECFRQNTYPSLLVFNRNPDIHFRSVNDDYFNVMRQLGAIIGLQYPYESMYHKELSNVDDFTLINSVMNNKHTVTFTDKTINILTPITPSFHDIKALKLLLGSSSNAKNGDTIYDLNELSKAAYKLATPPAEYISSRSSTVETLVDEDGINTLVINSVTENANINLNQGTNYFSKVGNEHYVVLFGNFHNIIDHSSNQNQLILNHENNIVDFGLNNHGNKTIITDTISGNDWILGFNTKFHQICIQSNDPYIPYHLERLTFGRVNFLNATISFESGTTIIINRDHTIFLPNVNINQLKNSISTQVQPESFLGRKEFLPYNQQQHITSLTNLPHLFMESMVSGAGYTFILNTSEYVLKRYHYSNDTINLSLTTLKIGFSIYNRSAIPLATELLCKRMGFSNETSQLIGISTNVAAKAITMPTPLGIVELMLRFSGSYLGSFLCNKLTFFANKCIPPFIEYLKEEDHHYNLR